MSLLYRIINIGIVKELTTTDIKRTKVLNYCCVFGLLSAMFFLVVDFFLGQLDLSKTLSFVIQIVVFIIIYYLQSKKKYKLGRVLFVILVLVALFYNTNFAFRGFYGEYSYIILPLLALFFFDSKLIHYSVLFLAISLYYLPNYINPIYPEKYFGYLNVLFQFFGTFILVNYFKKQNQKNENKLAYAYKELEDKKKNEFAHLQLKSLKAQMNPHFMFNALNSIQSLILKEDKHEAYVYLTKFASLIRENLNMSEKSFVNFNEELSLLKKYLELEGLRFRDNFEYEIIGEENVTNVKIPSMIIQPFVENSIKHGLLHKLKGVKKVSIAFYEEDVFKCVIIDNGIGMKASKEINSLSFKERSFSTKAIEDRLSLLKDYYKTDIGFKYEKIEEGTKVVIKIPYIHSNE